MTDDTREQTALENAKREVMTSFRAYIAETYPPAQHPATRDRYDRAMDEVREEVEALIEATRAEALKVERERVERECMDEPACLPAYERGMEHGRRAERGTCATCKDCLSVSQQVRVLRCSNGAVPVEYVTPIADKWGCTEYVPREADDAE